MRDVARSTRTAQAALCLLSARRSPQPVPCLLSEAFPCTLSSTRCTGDQRLQHGEAKRSDATFEAVASVHPTEATCLICCVSYRGHLHRFVCIHLMVHPTEATCLTQCASYRGRHLSIPLHTLPKPLKLDEQHLSPFPGSSPHALCHSHSVVGERLAGAAHGLQA